MNEEYLVKLYVDWLVEQIDDKEKAGLYEDLIELLFNTDFVWLESVPLDENKAAEYSQRE